MIILFYLYFTIIFYIKKPFDILQTKNYDESQDNKIININQNKKPKKNWNFFMIIKTKKTI